MAGGQTHLNAHFYKLEPPVAGRMTLETVPRERSVQCYVATRAAQRTLSLLTERRDSGSGDFFWLTDPAGAGKTHFLNYFLALRQRLAKAAQEDGRELVLAFDYAEPASAAQLENDILAALARELGGGDRRGAPLWRRIGAAAAFEVAMGEARRAGVRALTIVIDLGLNEAPAFAADLVRIARAAKRPSLTVIAAGRGDPPPHAVVTEVGPAGLSEQIVVAVGRVRRLEPRWTAMAHLYQGTEIAPFAPDEIFPFHPETLRALAALLEPTATIAGLARMAREVLADHKDTASLVYPYELFEVSELKRIIGDRLGTDGRAALRHASSAVQSMPRQNRQLAEQIVRTLVLAHLCGQAPALEIDQLWSRLPAVGGVAPGSHAGNAAPQRSQILQELASRGSRAITTSPVGAAFVLARESSPDIDRFNQALALLKLFDPGLEAAGDRSELTAAMARLGQALSNQIEEAQGVTDTLSRFALASNAQFERGVKRTIDAFIELAHSGARELVDLGADEKRASDAQRLVAAYRDMVAAAASVAALLAMRDYLEQTRLEPDNVDRREAPEVAALATERRLLEAELGPRAPYSKARDSLQARFERFKWTYAEQYRTAHERWRSQMGKASVLVLDIDRCLQALLRLDSIAALGPRLGAQFSAQVREARGAVRVCGLDGEFNASAAAICPECGYVLGTATPGDRLAGLLETIRRALREKLTALSRGAIARLIKKYDHAHRLDGFLKITQAAQTQALAAVLDDQLTAYLARLLRKRGEGDPGTRTGR